MHVVVQAQNDCICRERWAKRVRLFVGEGDGRRVAGSRRRTRVFGLDFISDGETLTRTRKEAGG